MYLHKMNIHSNHVPSVTYFVAHPFAPQGDIFAAAMGLDFENDVVHSLRVIAVDQATDPANRLTSTTTVSSLPTHTNSLGFTFSLSCIMHPSCNLILCGQLTSELHVISWYSIHLRPDVLFLVAKCSLIFILLGDSESPGRE